jgi:hypothetical protein
MNIKKILIAGIVINFVSFIIGGGSYHLFSWIFLLEPKDIWKWDPGTPLTSMPISWLIFLLIGNLTLAIIVALVYAILYQGIPGQGIKKGLMFGFLMWLVGVLAPMFSMYILLKVASEVVIYFTLQGLCEYLIYGAIISIIYKESKVFSPITYNSR